MIPLSHRRQLCLDQPPLPTNTSLNNQKLGRRCVSTRDSFSANCFYLWCVYTQIDDGVLQKLSQDAHRYFCSKKDPNGDLDKSFMGLLEDYRKKVKDPNGLKTIEPLFKCKEAT